MTETRNVRGSFTSVAAEEEWPSDPENREIVTEIRDSERDRSHMGLHAVSTVATADHYRMGVGGEFLFPVRPDRHVNVGARYQYFPGGGEKFWEGHQIDLIVDLPRRVDWGRIQGGLYGEVKSLTSWEEFKEEWHIGVLGGVEWDLWRPSQHFSVALDVKAGLGFGWPEPQQTLLQVGLVFAFTE